MLVEDGTSVEDVPQSQVSYLGKDYHIGSLTAPSRGRFWQGMWQSREHVGAVRGRGSINRMKVTLKFRTVARTELGMDSSVMPVEGQVRGINFRRDNSKNRSRSRTLDSFLDSRGVKLGDGFLIIRRGKNTICKERLYFREKLFISEQEICYSIITTF
jgi:hypothetical protein